MQPRPWPEDETFPGGGTIEVFRVAQPITNSLEFWGPEAFLTEAPAGDEKAGGHGRYLQIAKW